MSAAGRNDACPCGSGKKYKKCCLARDEALARQNQRAGSPAHVGDDFIAEIRPEIDEAVDKVLIRLDQHRLANVEADLEALLRENPEYHMTNYAMGVYQAIVLEDPAGAIPFLKKAIDIFPPLAEAHFNLGSCYLNLVRIPEAVHAFRNAIRYASDNDFVADKAHTELQRVERIVTKNGPFRTLDAFLENQRRFDSAYEHLTAQRYQEAVQLFSRVLEQNPKHVQSHGNIALAYAGLGKKALALEHLENALSLDPTYGPAIQNRTVLELMQEGVPLRPDHMAETEYYRACAEAERSDTARNSRRS